MSGYKACPVHWEQRGMCFGALQDAFNRTNAQCVENRWRRSEANCNFQSLLANDESIEAPIH